MWFMRFVPGPGIAVAAIGVPVVFSAVALLVTARTAHRRRVRRFVAGSAEYVWWRNVLLTAAVVFLAVSAAVFIAVFERV